MSPNLNGGRIVFKRTLDSIMEFGFHLIYQKKYSVLIIKELLFDDELNEVKDYFRYRYIGNDIDYYQVKCDRFISWDKNMDDRSEEDIVIFNEGGTYLIIDKDKNGITILDEQLKKVEILYRDSYYKFFQQM